MYTAESNEGRQLTIHHSETKYRSAVSTREANQYSEEIQQGVCVFIYYHYNQEPEGQGSISNMTA